MPNRLDGIGELIKLAILAQAFVLGCRSQGLRPLIIGMALGLLPSTAILFISIAGTDLVLHTTSHAGLFINSGSLAEISALVIIGLLHGANWHWRNASLWLAICLLPCVVLPQSRGAWLALIAAFTVWLWAKSKLSALALMALAVISFTYSLHINFHISSVIQRWGMWTDAVGGLTLLGHGIGSFWTDYAPLSNTLDIFLERPEHLHNDWLEILFELGLSGFLVVGVLSLLVARRAGTTEGIILAGFAAEALVGFPLHVPCTAFIAALCLGHAARNGVTVRDLLHAGRAKLRQLRYGSGAHWESTRQRPLVSA